MKQSDFFEALFKAAGELSKWSTSSSKTLLAGAASLAKKYGIPKELVLPESKFNPITDCIVNLVREERSDYSFLGLLLNISRAFAAWEYYLEKTSES